MAKSTVGKIVKRFEDTSEHSTLHRGKCERKCKTTSQDDKAIIRNSVMDPKKPSKTFRAMSSAGITVLSLTVQQSLLGVGRIARKLVHKQLLTSAMKTKRLCCAGKYAGWKGDSRRK